MSQTPQPPPYSLSVGPDQMASGQPLPPPPPPPMPAPASQPSQVTYIAPSHITQVTTGLGRPEYTRIGSSTYGKSNGIVSSVSNALSSAFYGGSSKRIEDVYIAVMGVTGAGKSTFIAQCSKLSPKIGHGLASCTSQVDDFFFMWNDHIRVHLIDTPGFDDTVRSDTEVLREIASWLTATYKKKMLLSGIIYLQRVSDPRVGGAQMKNLLMFKQLCGKDCFSSVVLATTFWETTEYSLAVEHERQLVDTKDFWGYMVKKGSRVVRHSNNAQSACNIVDIILKQKKKIVTELQYEMVDDKRELDETAAGISLNKELIEKEKQHKEELKELEEQMQEAIAAKDYENIEIISKLQEEADKKIQQGEADIVNLQASVKELQNERDAAYEKIEKDLKKVREEYAAKLEAYEITSKKNTADTETTAAELAKTKAELERLVREANQKRSGWSKLGEALDDIVEEITTWFNNL